MPSANLARLVLIEARRSALPWLAAAAVAASLALAAFLSQVALADRRALELALVAALLRACAVFLVAVHVATSVSREMNDKGLEMLLSLPLARSTQYLGRLAGFAACGAAVAVLFGVPLLLWAPAQAVALWVLSLALECMLVAAATLFFAVSLGQLVAALSATVGFYLLARSIAAVQAMASSPLAETSTAQEAARWAVDAVALLLPHLDGVTRTGWLLYEMPEPRAYLQALASLVIYCGLLAAAGLFDFHRENF